MVQHALPQCAPAVGALTGGTLGAGLPGCLNDYGYQLTGRTLDLEVLSSDLIEVGGDLELTVRIQVDANTALVPMSVELGAVCNEGSCSAWVDRFVSTITVPLAVSVASGTWEASGAPSTSHAVTGSNVQIADCTGPSIVDAISSVYNPQDIVLDATLADVEAAAADLVAVSVAAGPFLACVPAVDCAADVGLADVGSCALVTCPSATAACGMAPVTTSPCP